jgi:hypothetical protein
MQLNYVCGTIRQILKEEIKLQVMYKAVTVEVNIK